MAIEYACIMPHPPLIVPRVGGGQEKQVRGTAEAMDKAARIIARIKPETIVLSTPHSVMYGDYIHISPGESASGDFGAFGAPDVSFGKTYDTEFVSALSGLAFERDISAGALGERDKRLDHATLVPLYFVDKYYTDYKLVRVSISGLPLAAHYSFGRCVSDAAESLNRRTVFIASGDLSHKLSQSGPYGFDKRGPEFDLKVTKAMKTADFSRFFSFTEHFCEAAAECGLRGFTQMAGALDGRSLETAFYSYEGPFGVGYAVCGFKPAGADENRRFGEIYHKDQSAKLERLKKSEDDYVRLARQSLETYVKTGKYLKLPDGLPDELTRAKAGVFVSLKKDGRLRGCVGTIAGAEPSIAREIIRNAVSAGTGDTRFSPVEEYELPYIVYSVDVLGEPEHIETTERLDVLRYGVIVYCGRKRGLLLPCLEGIDTPQKQIGIALQKAGIRENENYKMERFEVVRHKAHTEGESE
ncbi:MAG: AmmeMemoRadiSam system protein A [Firmicutes bacterium]|nr:AmmeMemoRadiSam system protein A [Bacillota bacterium]